jgi:hypothetical protein
VGNEGDPGQLHYVVNVQQTHLSVWYPFYNNLGPIPIVQLMLQHLNYGRWAFGIESASIQNNGFGYVVVVNLLSGLD